MKVKPVDNDLRKTVMWEGKEWWWCEKETGGKCNPGKYRRRKPSECRGMKRKRNQKEEEKSEEKEKDSAKRLKISEAFAAVQDSVSDDDGDSSGYES